RIPANTKSLAYHTNQRGTNRKLPLPPLLRPLPERLPRRDETEPLAHCLRDALPRRLLGAIEQVVRDVHRDLPFDQWSHASHDTISNAGMQYDTATACAATGSTSPSRRRRSRT